MLFRFVIIAIMTLFLSQRSYAQCGEVAISLPSNACIGSSLQILNNDSGDEFEWDLCPDDFSKEPTASKIQNINLSRIMDLEMVYDGLNYFGFAVSISGNTIYRMDFGQSLDNTPVITNLGNVGGLFNSPTAIVISKEGDKWVAVVANANNDLILLDFGLSLNSNPAASVFLSRNGSGYTTLALAKTSSAGRVLVIGDFNGKKVVTINYPNGLLSASTSSFSSAIGANAIDVQVMLACDAWYVFALGIDSRKLYRLAYGSSFSSAPAPESVAVFSFEPYRLAVVNEGHYSYGFVTNTAGGISRVNFGSDVTITPAVTSLGTFNLLSDSRSLWAGVVNGEGRAFTSNFIGGEVSKLSFINVCDASIRHSSQKSVTGLSYTSSGMKSVSVNAFRADGTVETDFHSFEIADKTIGEISIQSVNNCIEAPVEFSLSETGTAFSTVTWNFGDGQSNESVSTLHQYAARGEYQVSALVQAQNGCASTSTKSVSVYNKPVANFRLPTDADYCTNEVLLFQNESTTDEASAPQWRWYLDNEVIADTEDLEISVVDEGEHTVKLVSSLEGCESSFSATLPLLKAGPAASFEFTKFCLDSVARFQSTSIGNVDAYEWKIDGSVVANGPVAEYVFTTPGNHDVSLLTSGGGCDNGITESLSLKEGTFADFNFGPAIENVPIEFAGVDLTTGTDDVSTWKWSFDGLAFGSSKDSKRSFPSPGNYDIDLEVITVQGCKAELSKTITVTTSTEPTLDFKINQQLCKEQHTDLINLSVNAERYVWDVCHKDLISVPSISSNITITPGSTTVFSSLTIQYDRGKWFGFVTDLSGRKLIRLDYGANIDSSPSVTSLGDFGGKLTSPGPVQLVRYNGEWYAFVLNVFSNNIARIRIGSVLDATPVSSELLAVQTALPTPIGATMVISHGNYFLFVSNNGGQIKRLDFGSSPLNTPTGTAIATSIANPWGITVTEQNGKWYGFVASTADKKVYKLDFGTDLSSNPAATVIASNIPDVVELELEKEGDVYLLFARAHRNSIHRILLGSNLDAVQPETTWLGGFGGQLETESRSMAIVRNTPGWKLFTIDSRSGVLYSLNFLSPCTSVGVEQSATKTQLIFHEAGQYLVELTGVHTNGESRSLEKIVTIDSKTSPAIQINTNESRCLGETNQFTLASNVALESVKWSFSDGASSEEQTALHKFSLKGSQWALLEVVGENGCPNSAQSLVEIYERPHAGFSLPSDVLCTNTPLDFVNATDDIYNGLLSFKWLINDQQKGSDRDFSYNFSGNGGYEVKLIASIPGCSSEFGTTITNLQEGPHVDFAVSGQCENDIVRFQNMSSGNVDGFKWKIGEVESIVTSPELNMSSGSYIVRLSAKGTNECVSTLEKPVEIFKNPIANFTSVNTLLCQKNSITFTDASTSIRPITERKWLFPGNVLSNEPGPAFTFINPGLNSVRLEVRNDKGCSASVQKEMLILPVPDAGFTETPICVGSPVTFTPNANFSSAEWHIADKTYKTRQATHNFRTPGVFSASLTATALNGCTQTNVKELVVYPEPEMDFAVTKNCVSEPTEFTSLSTSQDPISTWTWSIDETQLTGDNVTHTFSENGNQNITLKLGTAGGCSYEMSKVIEVTAKPVAAFSSSSRIGHPGMDFFFNNISEGATEYSWSFGDNTVSTDFSPVHAFPTVGNYVVTLTASNLQQCSSIANKTFQVSSPLPDARILAVTSTEKPDKTVELLVTIENAGTTTLKNLKIDIDISGNLNLSRTVEESIFPESRYNLTLPFGIQRDESLDFICIEAITEGDILKDNNKNCVTFERDAMKLMPAYPNPSRGNVSVEWIGIDSDEIQLSLVDRTGVVLAKQVTTSVKGLNSKTFDFSSVPEGIYLLVIQAGSRIQSQRIIIGH